MGRVVFAIETRFHSHEGQETREGTSSFSSIQGLQAGFFTNKGWAPSEPGTPPHSGRRYFREASWPDAGGHTESMQGWSPGQRRHQTGHGQEQAGAVEATVEAEVKLVPRAERRGRRVALLGRVRRS